MQKKLKHISKAGGYMIKTYRSGFKSRPLVRDRIGDNGKVAEIGSPSLLGANYG